MQYGYSERWAAYAAAREGLTPARVTAEQRDIYTLITEGGERRGRVSGKFMGAAVTRSDFPAVGDFVLTDPNPGGDAVIHEILPRRSQFVRRRSNARDGEDRFMGEQVAAANFDYVFIMSSLNSDLNVRRIERYLTVAWNSGGVPAVVLTKADLCPDPVARDRVSAALPGVDALAVSAVTGQGLPELARYFAPGKTCVFLGMSGVGKSTLLNALYGSEVMKTGGIREGDDRGRHTTTHRQMVLLPSGALVIDTPGMRSLGIGESDEGVDGAFSDVTELASSCRFADCGHGTEPGCAVRAAIEDGSLSAGRFENYKKLLREQRHVLRKENIAAMTAQKQQLKNIHKQQKEHYMFSTKGENGRW